MIQLRILLMFIIAACVLLAGLSDAAAQQADDQRPPPNLVTIRSMQYTPATISVRVGETVTWHNADDRDHTVIGDRNAFRSPNIRSGERFAHRFTRAGTFDYRCTYHPRMRGRVVVTE